MAYRVCLLDSKSGPVWALVENDRALPVKAAGLRFFFERKASELEISGDAVPLTEARILCPVSYPAAIICQGKNYSEHIREAGMNPDDKNYNQFFLKATSALAPAIGKVIRPAGVRLLDYECELALIIRKNVNRPERITNANLHEFVGGVTVANDISARDIQIPQGQWFKGKSYRGFCPVGPFVSILDRSDFAQMEEWRLTLTVNGEERQSARIGSMIFPPAETLTELSGLMDLHAGDLILTGTPSGVALKAPGGALKRIASLLYSEKKLMELFVKRQLAIPRYLRDGDLVQARLSSPDPDIDSGAMQLTITSQP